MKIVLALLLILVLMVLAVLFYLGKQSAAGLAPGLVDDQLARCPQTPNCVCSEYPDDTDHYIAPLDKEVSVEAIEALVKRLGGQVVSQSDHYVSAVFVSSIFRFVDDVEFRIDPLKGLVHIRSASRVGRSDLGVNRDRAEKIRAMLK